MQAGLRVFEGDAAMRLSPQDAVSLAWDDLQDLHLRTVASPALLEDDGFVAEMNEAFDRFYQLYGEWAEA